jgi:hypothetical protein
VRTYGRVTDELGNKRWVVVTTDANGFNDEVYLTTLAQCLKLNLGESPFFSNYGLPAHESVVTQVFPTFYVMRTQQQFAPFFASLIITQVPGVAADKFHAPGPTYNVKAVTHQGAILPNVTIPTSVPT